MTHHVHFLLFLNFNRVRANQLVPRSTGLCGHTQDLLLVIFADNLRRWQP